MTHGTQWTVDKYNGCVAGVRYSSGDYGAELGADARDPTDGWWKAHRSGRYTGHVFDVLHKNCPTESKPTDRGRPGQQRRLPIHVNSVDIVVSLNGV